jgi:hypothetical protein
VRLSFIEALFRADHVGVAWVERQRVAERLPSLHGLLDLELPHLATSFSIFFRRAPSGWWRCKAKMPVIEYVHDGGWHAIKRLGIPQGVRLSVEGSDQTPDRRLFRRVYIGSPHRAIQSA